MSGRPRPLKDATKLTVPRPILQKLSPRHEAFCRRVVAGESYTDAFTAIWPGKRNRRTAAKRACEMMANPLVAARVAELQEAATSDAVMGREEVLRELTLIARSDMRRLMSWGPDGVALRDSGEVADDDARAVAEVSESRTKEGGSLRLKLHDKLAALDKLARHHGLLVDRTEVSGPGGGPIEIKPASPLETARQVAFLLAQATAGA